CGPPFLGMISVLGITGWPHSDSSCHAHLKVVLFNVACMDGLHSKCIKNRSQNTGVDLAWAKDT
ncbi:hypothetical protein ILYODFUR_013510, partial [Ilyodon furcidens]